MKITNIALSIHELGQRSNQEDSIWPDVTKSTSDLYILCDGMGGHEKGEVASQTVCEAMSNYIREHCRKDDWFDQDDFMAALSSAYDALDAKDDVEAVKKMGTTMTFLKFHAGGCFVAHIGDSRIYQIRPSAEGKDRIVFVTRDHSLVNDLIALGEMTPEEAKTSKQKNVITRAMQPNQDRRAKADFVNLTDVREGDYFYMCSDGMLEVSEDEEIANVLSMKNSDDKKVDILKAVTADNRDNHSAFIIKVTDVEEDKTPSKEVEEQVIEEKPVQSAEPEIKEIAPVTKPAKKKHGGVTGLIVFALIAVLAALFLVMKCGKDGKPETAAQQSGQPAVATTGWITVKSTPDGAVVFLDGRSTGRKTPCTLSNCRPGSHKVKLDLEGYTADPQSVIVVKGQKTTCKFDMKKVQAAPQDTPQASQEQAQENAASQQDGAEEQSATETDSQAGSSADPAHGNGQSGGEQGDDGGSTLIIGNRNNNVKI